MRQMFACLAVSSLLAACSTVPDWTPPDTPEIAPVRLDPVVCLAPEEAPAIPPDAGVIAPETADEKRAVYAFMGWVEQVLDHAAEGWARVEAARAGCR